MASTQQQQNIQGQNKDILINWINSLENDSCLLVSDLSDQNDGKDLHPKNKNRCCAM